MDFEFNSEQLQLADAVRRLVEKDYGFEARNKMIAAAADGNDAMWGKLVDLGLTALPIPEAQGGFDGTAVDLLLVMQELGRGLVAEPYFATIFAAEFVKRAGVGAHMALLEKVASGSSKLAAALGENGARHDLFAITTKADVMNNAANGGYLLTGRKDAVLFGAQADSLVVSARIKDGDDGLALFVVDANASGITRNDMRTLDGQRVAQITFERVALDESALLARGRAASELLDAAIDYGIALLCAEAVGTMEALNAATLEYAKTRKQFGQPIARFQVLQHRMVEMFMHLEQARSMTYLAAVRSSSSDAAERSRTASAAKVRVGQAARFIGQQAVQIHGGMGMTNELPAAHLFKRLTMFEMTLGDTDHHLQRFIATSTGAAVEQQRDVVPATNQPLQRAA